MGYSGFAKFAGPRYTIRMVANAVGKEYSEADRAYLAGFLDADGAVMATIEKHQEMKYGFRVRVIVKITQRDEKNLQWFQKTFTFGSTRKNKGSYDWLIRNKDHVLNVLELAKPYIKAKIHQVDIATKILTTPVKSEQDLLQSAQLADTLSRFNVRSKNRRSNFASMVQGYFSCND